MSSHDPTVPTRTGGGDTRTYTGGPSGGGVGPPPSGGDAGDGDDGAGPSLPRWAVVAVCGGIALVAFLLVVFVFSDGEPEPEEPTTTQPTASTTSTSEGPSSTQGTSPPTAAPTAPPTDAPVTLLPSTVLTLPTGST